MIRHEGEDKGHDQGDRADQITNPDSSGAADTALVTFVQLMGEEEAFEYLKALHANVNQCTKSGSTLIKAAAQGETLIGIVFQHDVVTQKVAAPRPS